MIHPRIAITFVACVPLALAGCGGEPAGEFVPSAPAGAPAARYAPRTDLLAVAIPDGAPTHWPAAGYPPLRSARLFPDTPDRDLAADLRKQLGKSVLDPTDASILTPSQADQITRLVDAHFGTPLAPTVRVPDWDTVVASAVVRLEKPDAEKPLTFGGTVKAAKERLKSFKWDVWKADWEAAAAAKAELKLDDAALARGSVL